MRRIGAFVSFAMAALAALGSDAHAQDGKTPASLEEAALIDVRTIDPESFQAVVLRVPDGLAPTIVVAVPAVVRRFADVKVIHCHGPSGKGPAITRSSGALWDRKNGIAIRRVGR